MEETFVEKNFAPKTLAIIDRAIEILAAYSADGMTMTLRQVFYQFVQRNWIVNKQSEYKRLGSILNDGRLAGLIDWDFMEDRLRNLETFPSWDGQAAYMDAAASWYREDMWDAQSYRPEVWVEKDALSGVIERACGPRRVPYFVCRGNTSQSEQYVSGRRLADHIERGQTPIIFYLGDHDPNGIDMTRDNRDRLTMFAREDIEVRRLALNMDQVRRYNPPPNPVKFKDSRSGGYVKQFGNKSWELDALDPPVIVELIRNAIEELIDDDQWENSLAHEAQQRKELKYAASSWYEIEEFLKERKAKRDAEVAKNLKKPTPKRKK